MSGTTHSKDFDLGKLKDELQEFGRLIPAILGRSLHRAATAGRTAMVRLIAQDTGLQSKYVTRNIAIEKLGEKLNPRVAVVINARRIPLIAFAARGPEPSRGKGRGVSYRLLTGRGRNPKAFIAAVPNAGPEANWHKGVFVRSSQLDRGARPQIGKSAGAWSKNLPIKQLYGPSVAHVFEKKLPDFYAVAEEALIKNLTHEIDWRRSKAAPAQEFPVQPV